MSASPCAPLEMRLRLAGVLAVMLAAALTIGGCAAPPVRYYSLAGAVPDAGVPAAAVPAGAVGQNGAPIHIEVAPVGVPERLARPQMVIRNASRSAAGPVSPQVDVLEQQRWASSLDSELRDAFAAAIASRAGAVDVTRGGRLPGQPVYRIAIRVGQFDTILDRQVDAVFGWTITRSDDSRHAICEVPVSRPAGKGMDELVQAVKQVVAVAATNIATQLLQLQARGAADCAVGANAGNRPAGEPGATSPAFNADLPAAASDPDAPARPAARNGAAARPSKASVKAGGRAPPPSGASSKASSKPSPKATRTTSKAAPSKGSSEASSKAPSKAPSRVSPKTVPSKGPVKPPARTSDTPAKAPDAAGTGDKAPANAPGAATPSRPEGIPASR
jgi:uncharacterized lipoprotein YmbA